MKKTMTFLLLILMSSVKSPSQSVFPETGAIWNIRINGTEHYYGLSGDTTLNEINYHKLFLLNDTTLNIDSKDIYIGGFRNETKKVWFLPSCYWEQRTDQKEVLLHDFSKNVGDTIWHNGMLDGQSSAIAPCFINEDQIGIGRRVVSVIGDIIEEDGVKKYQARIGYLDEESRIHYFLNSLYYYRENSGSLSGLFWFLKEDPMSGGAHCELACFKQGGEVKFINSTQCNTCFCSSNAGFLNNDYSPIEVVWSPKQKSVEIKGNSLVLPLTLKLFDKGGRLIIQKNMQMEKERVFLEDHVGDVFLFQLEKENRIIKTGKLTISVDLVDN